jgi:hypothetical protein
MSSSSRSRKLALVLATTALAAAPASALAMPAGPDAPSPGGSTVASPAPEPPARVSAPLATDGEDVAVVLAAGAFLVVVAGGTAFAHRHAHAFPQA